MRSARPAAEIEPDRATSSSTATLPGPILAPEARSIRMLSRSRAICSGDFAFRLRMTGPQRLVALYPCSDIVASGLRTDPSTAPDSCSPVFRHCNLKRLGPMRFLLLLCVLLVPLSARAQELT